MIAEKPDAPIIAPAHPQHTTDNAPFPEQLTTEAHDNHRNPSRLTLIALMIALILVLILLDRPLIRGDSLAYLVWTDTLAGDFDINFNNQHDRFHTVNTYQIQWNVDTERWVNIFPFGIAYLQAPFYWTGKVFAEANLLDANPDYFQSMQGVPQAISVWMMIGANLMAIGACVLAYRIGRRLCDSGLSALIAFAVFIGTPLVYYSTISPVNSHNAGAFTIAVFLYLLVRCTGALSDNPIGVKHPAWWIVLGIFGGLSILVRWQLAVAIMPAWVLLAYHRQWRGLAFATVSAGLTLLPLLLIWQAMFGVPILVPFDAVSEGGFMQTGDNYALNVLEMLMSHSPIVLVSLIGLMFLWRKDRAWSLTLGAMIALQLIVNGAALDWNAGETYGMRRMSELYAVYVLLTCVTVAHLNEWLRSNHPKFVRWGRIAIIAGFGAIIVYSVAYIGVFIVYSWHHPAWQFDNTPGAMFSYFSNLPHRWQVLWEVYQSHVGILAWNLPGA